MTAHEALRHALDALAASGEVLACQLPDRAPLWISERASDRAEAAEACHGCPALDACAAVGRREPFGVWGGRDSTQKPGKRRTPPKAPAPRKPRRVPDLDPITCPGCGGTFQPTQHTAKYCSPKCRSRGVRARRLARLNDMTTKEAA